MRKRKTKSLDQSATNGREKARTTENNGRKNYSKKSGKASKPSRKKDGRASGGRKQQKDTHRQAFKLSDHLSEEIIEKLRVIKEAEKENGRTNLKRPTSRK